MVYREEKFYVKRQESVQVIITLVNIAEQITGF